MTLQTTLRPIRGSDLKIAVSDESARSGPFIRSDIRYYCATDSYVKLGDSTVEASDSDFDMLVPAGQDLDFNVGGNTYLAAIIASGTDTAYINEWSKKAE